MVVYSKLYNYIGLLKIHLQFDFIDPYIQLSHHVL